MRFLLRRYGPKTVGLVTASLAALIGTAVGTRLLTEVVNTEVFGDFKLTVGIGVLFVGTVFQPLIQYAMRAYHDADGGESASTFVAEGRRAVEQTALLMGVATACVSLVIAALVGDVRIAGVGIAASLFAGATAAAGFETGLLDTRGSVVTAASYRAVAALALPVAAALTAIATGSSSAAMVLAQALLLLAAAYFLRRFTPGGTPVLKVRAWIRNSLPFSFPLAAVGLVSWLFNIGDRYLLAALAGASEVGVYAAAYGLAASPLAALGSLLPTLAYASLYRAAAGGSEGRRRLLSNRLLGMQAVVVSMGVVAVALLAPVAVQFLLAEDFREGSVAIMRWVAIGQGFQVLAFALDLDSLSIGKTRRMLISYSAAAVVAFALNLLLVPKFGALGAAQATAGSGLVYFLMMLVMARGRASGITTKSSLKS